MRVLGLLVRVIFAPLVFLVAGILGAWSFILLRKDELDDGRPATHDITQVAPDEENDDRKRSYARDQWLFDRTPLQRTYAVECAQKMDAAEMAPNPVPFDVWCANRRVRQLR